MVNIGEAKAFILEGVAKELLQGVFHILLQIARAFTGFMGNIFTGILNFGFRDMSVVKSGWTITRDIVNMFFILGLVVIAFATILRIETYGIKALLPKLIMIALLINFSYLVCGIIIDITQIITVYFLAQIGTNDVGLAVLDSLNAVDAIRGSEGATVTIGTQDVQLVTILTTAFATAVIALCGIILLIGAVLLFIRIGALWVLMILAPFAWFFSVFPTLKAQASKWWNEFLKWAFFAPVYVFFIYLVIRISQTQALAVLDSSAAEPTALTSLMLSPMFQDLNLLFKFVFLVILLLGAPMVAMSMGIRGASTVIGFSKKLYKVPLKGARKGIKTFARKFERDVLAPRGFSPRAFRAAWKARREEKEAKKMEPAVGAWRDRLNLVLGREKTFHKQRADDLLESKERRDLARQNLSKEGLVDFTAAAKKSRDVPKFTAGMAELISRGDEEGLFEHLELGKDYKHIASPENLQKLIKNTIPNKKEAIRFAGKMGALAKMSNIPQYDGMVEYDSKKKEMVWVDEKEVGTRGGYEAMKIHPQARWRSLNRRAYLTTDTSLDKETGEAKDAPVAVTNTLRVMLRNLTKDDTTRAAKEMPGLNQKYIIKGKAQVQAEIDTITDTAQKQLAQDWLDNIQESVASTAEAEHPEITTGGITDELREAGVA